MPGLVSLAPSTAGKHAGLTVNVTGLGPVRLVHALATNPETALYQTDHEGVAVKVFDLECGRADEVSYGPYANFQAELQTFEEIIAADALRGYVPTYLGASVDYERKHACIAMELLAGQNLRSWAVEVAEAGFPPARLGELRRAVIEALGILDRLHQHGMVVIDFKPDNVIRLPDGAVRLVDLGAFLTPRHARQPGSFVYAATPDHAEVLIDASNLQAGITPTAASDFFSAGVALFELATGNSRLEIDPGTADDMLASPALYRFRDTQIVDVWRAFPHLHQSLPLVKTQLEERRVLFAEIWHLLKAYVGSRVPDWENLPADQQGQILLATGTTFIMEQLPEPVAWLAGAIARATVLRSFRLTRAADLVALLVNPADEGVRIDVAECNGLVRALRAIELPVDFVDRLNVWDVRAEPPHGHWAVAAPMAAWEVGANAEFVYLRQSGTDEEGHRFWLVVDEFEADAVDGTRMNLGRLAQDHTSWLGSAG